MICQAVRRSTHPAWPPLKCWMENDHIFHYDIRYQAWWLEQDADEAMVPAIIPTFPHELLTAAVA